MKKVIILIFLGLVITSVSICTRQVNFIASTGDNGTIEEKTICTTTINDNFADEEDRCGAPINMVMIVNAKKRII